MDLCSPTILDHFINLLEMTLQLCPEIYRSEFQRAEFEIEDLLLWLFQSVLLSFYLDGLLSLEVVGTG